MDRDPVRPLTPQEAKARLRAAAQQLSQATWGTRRWRILGLALAGGFVTGCLRAPAFTSRPWILQKLAPMLLAMFLGRRRRRSGEDPPQ